MFLHITYAFSQSIVDGYIIDAEKDTIFGKIVPSNVDWFRRVTFEEASGKRSRYSAERHGILGYGFGQKHFKLNEEDRIYLECVIDGEVGLYYSGHSYYLDLDSTFLEIKYERRDVYREGIKYSADDETWSERLIYIGQGCEEALKIPRKENKPNRINLSEYVIALNECRSSEYIEYSSDYSRTSWDVAIGALATQHDLSDYSAPRVNFGKSTERSLAPSIEVGFNLGSTLFGKQVNFRFGFLLATPVNEYSVVEQRPTQEVIHNVSVNSTIVSFPISMDFPLYDSRRSKLLLRLGPLIAAGSNKKILYEEYSVANGRTLIRTGRNEATFEQTGVIRYFGGLVFEKSFNDVRAGLKLTYLNHGSSDDEVLTQSEQLAAYIKF